MANITELPEDALLDAGPELEALALDRDTRRVLDWAVLDKLTNGAIGERLFFTPGKSAQREGARAFGSPLTQSRTAGTLWPWATTKLARSS